MVKLHSKLYKQGLILLVIQAFDKEVEAIEVK